MSYLLVKFKDDYMGEFDVEGLLVTDTSLWEEYQKMAADLRWPIFIFFGANESLSYLSYQEYIAKFSVSEISDKEYEFFKSKIGDNFGNFPIISLANDNYEEF